MIVHLPNSKRLIQRRRTLLSSLPHYFFDTTNLYIVLPWLAVFLRVRCRPISTRKQNVANNWELRNDFVKLPHVEKHVWQSWERKARMHAGWSVWYLTQLVWTNQLSVTLLLTPSFPTPFHLFPTFVCFYYGIGTPIYKDYRPLVVPFSTSWGVKRQNVHSESFRYWSEIMTGDYGRKKLSHPYKAGFCLGVLFKISD